MPEYKRSHSAQEYTIGQNTSLENLGGHEKNKLIVFEHKIFKSDKPRTFNVELYCVKKHQRRWYVHGRNVDEEKILIFSLDRVIELDISEVCFETPVFDADEFFSDF